MGIDHAARSRRLRRDGGRCGDWHGTRRAAIGDVSDLVFVLVCAAAALGGYLVGPVRNAVAIPPAIWVAAVLVAGLNGAFHATGEDSGAGVFVFTAIPTLAWVLLAEAGTAFRRRADRSKSMPGPGS